MYVANGADGTVQRLDATIGTPSGAPIGAGEAPWQIVAEPGGSLLVLSVAARLSGSLTHVTVEGGVRKTSPKLLGDGEPVAPFLTQIAGNSGPSAAVTFQPRSAVGPHAALMNVATGVVRDSFAGGGKHDRVLAMAFDDSPTLPGIYLSLWSDWMDRTPGEGYGKRHQSGRLVALDALRGSVLATLPVTRAPTHLALTPWRGDQTRRLYAVMVDPGLWSENASSVTGPIHMLARFEAESLAPVHVSALTEAIGALVIAPDARTAYSLLDPTQGGIIAQVDLDTGMLHRVARLPALAISLVMSGDRLVAAEPARNFVWILDRKRGTVIRSVTVGNGPIGLAAVIPGM